MNRGIFRCNVLQSVSLDFCVTYLFPGTRIDFCFMMFTEVLMTDLARMSIHVRRLLNGRVSFKMLISMCLVIVEKEL